MSEIEIFARAKINLTLDVLGKREDGYHEMRMVMQSVSLSDRIVIRLEEGPDIRADTDLPYVPDNMDNLACKAAAAFLKAVGMEGRGMSLTIRKSIPVCAGLGGGSADAAAVIYGLDRLLGTGLGQERLLQISRSVGSDVAFCLVGGTMLASGRGDELRALSRLPDCAILICKPMFSVSTPVLFSKIDSGTIKYHPDTDGMIWSLEAGDITEVSRRCYNIFEDFLPQRERRTVDGVKDSMLTHGALGASMTGTGSAVYGIFSDWDRAMTAKEELERSRFRCFLTAPVENIWK